MYLACRVDGFYILSHYIFIIDYSYVLLLLLLITFMYELVPDEVIALWTGFKTHVGIYRQAPDMFCKCKLRLFLQTFSRVKTVTVAWKVKDSLY